VFCAFVRTGIVVSKIVPHDTSLHSVPIIVHRTLHNENRAVISVCVFRGQGKEESVETMVTLMYLLKDSWSPRFDSTFYTVKIEGKQVISAPPLPSLGRRDELGGKPSFPAYYYDVVIYREHSRMALQRRYSEFKWLYDQICKSPPADEQDPNAEPIRMPPGTCPFQWQNDEFAQNRLEQLSELLEDALRRPGYANHPAVIQFLNLDPPN